ncbi:MAG: ribonuclease III [Firmicutes bacterium]|nr:ribonuclease III [Bacillota bacterium]
MQRLMKKIGYVFTDERLLTAALTHSSYSNENKKEGKSYERLEFLGDSVLSFVVSSYIYNNFKSLPEGGLSKLRAALVCEKSLANCAKKLSLGKHLLLSKGEAATGGRERPSILADVFEAIIGAIYLDGGIEHAEKFIIENLSESIEKVKSGKEIYKDYKTVLQEQIQQKDSSLKYNHVKEEGPEHSKIFTVEVSSDGEMLARASGRSKKDAEQNAAHRALKKMGYEKI